MLKYVLDLLVGQASLVICDYRDLPRFQPTLEPLVLPEDLRIVGEAPVLANTSIRSCRGLAPHEAIAGDFVSLQLRRLSPPRCP